jgi:hypothetical protein
MKNCGLHIADCGIGAVECARTCFCTFLRPGSLTLYAIQRLRTTTNTRVISRRRDAEGSCEHSYCRQNIFSHAQIVMRDLSLALGMTNNGRA